MGYGVATCWTKSHGLSDLLKGIKAKAWRVAFRPTSTRYIFCFYMYENCIYMFMRYTAQYLLNTGSWCDKWYTVQNLFAQIYCIYWQVLLCYTFNIIIYKLLEHMLICRIWGFFAEKKSTTFCHRIYLASQYISIHHNASSECIYSFTVTSLPRNSRVCLDIRIPSVDPPFPHGTCFQRSWLIRQNRLENHRLRSCLSKIDSKIGLPRSKINMAMKRPPFPRKKNISYHYVHGP